MVISARDFEQALIDQLARTWSAALSELSESERGQLTKIGREFTKYRALQKWKNYMGDFFHRAIRDDLFPTASSLSHGAEGYIVDVLNLDLDNQGLPTFSGLRRVCEYLYPDPRSELPITEEISRAAAYEMMVEEDRQSARLLRASIPTKSMPKSVRVIAKPVESRDYGRKLDLEE